MRVGRRTADVNGQDVGVYIVHIIVNSVALIFLFPSKSAGVCSYLRAHILTLLSKCSSNSGKVLNMIWG